MGSTPAWRISWGPQNEQAAIQAIHTALDYGVNWIDTAPFYGWGRAEELVGQALQGKRDQILLFTKCGTIPDGHGGCMIFTFGERPSNSPCERPG